MYKAAEPTVTFMLNVHAERPLQAQLFEQIRAMIHDGQLKSGQALPATRALSEQLGVSRNTVVLAYDRLLSEGYIESKRSIGTFVSQAIPDDGILLKEPVSDAPLDALADEGGVSTAQFLAEQHLADHDFDLDEMKSDRPTSLDLQTEVLDLGIDFCPGLMDADLFPVGAWRRIYHRKCAQIERYLNHVDPQGLYELRRAIADHLGPARGIISRAQDIVVTTSVQDARALLSQLLLHLPGQKQDKSHVIMESPGPAGVAELAHQAKAELIAIEVDEEGLRTDLLAKIKQDPLRGMIYVCPGQHFPLGLSLSLQRRIELLEWAHTSGLMVVEDESDSDFCFSGAPLTALKGLDNHDDVIYLGGFEKAMGTALGLGFLVLPRPLIKVARMIRKTTLSGPSNLEQASMAEFLESGAYDRHLRKCVKRAKEKRDILEQALHSHFGDTSFVNSQGGLQLGWPVPDRFGSAEKIADQALSECQLKLYPLGTGGSYLEDKTLKVAGKKARQILIFGFGALSVSEINQGVERLALLLNGALKPKAGRKA